MHTPNTNDGTNCEPYLRTDLNLGTLGELPDWSTAPRGDAREVAAALKAAGFMGTQGGDIAINRELGLGTTGGGRVNRPGEAGPIAKSLKEKGYDAATLHVGWGMESDAEIDAIVADIVAATVEHDFPLYIETHRATITQDIQRTVAMIERNPGVRINGDFSHWYTGLEMVYGDFLGKLDFLAPVFERVRFLHARIGNPGCMQVDIGDGTGRTYVDHFREMWTRSFMGFLRSAEPGDYISFNPELLPSRIYYARVFPDPDGALREECDRYEQAILYSQIARDCFADAQRRLSSVDG